MAGADPDGIYLTDEDDVYVYVSDGSFRTKTVYGLAGDDMITGSITLRAIDGGAGDDTIRAAFEIETRGGRGDELIIGCNSRSTVQSDNLFGGAGNDHIIQQGAASRISGGSGDDTIDLGTFYCKLSAGSGDDAVSYDITVGAGNRILSLGAGDDVVDGSASFAAAVANGVVNTYGRAGDDLVIAGAGRDLFDGGSGVDEISYAFENAAVEIDLATGVTGGAAENDVLKRLENVTGSNFDDRLSGNALANTLVGRAGADTIDGGAGDDVLVGGAGADVLTGGAGADIFFYGPGDRIVDFDASEGDIMIHREGAAAQLERLMRDVAEARHDDALL